MNRHPIIWISSIVQNYVSNGIMTRDAFLSFSKYRYIQRSYHDLRTKYNVNQNNLDTEFLLSALMDLDDGEDLAFQSDIYDCGGRYHIPLIDFSVKDIRFLENPLREFSAYWNMGFFLFNSGRSFHAYGNRIIDHQEWGRFMGSLLLINNPGGARIIDDRWIGHRIMAGYSALRWSKNSNQYKRYPTYCGQIDNNGHFNYLNNDCY